MKYDSIVIAGTSESREVISQELNKGHRVLACVATELGAEMFKGSGIDVHTGRLDEEGFVRLFTFNPCEKIIDASHPFAKIVTETVKSAAKKLGIPYERYERKELTYDYDRIIYVEDAAGAVEQLNAMEGNILLTTGVNTAAVYAEGVRDSKERVYIRVLDNETSYAGCRKAGYPEDHVFGEMPPFTVEDNLRLIRLTDAKVMVSKDSGKTGGVDIKVQACREAGIAMVMIRRPGMSSGNATGNKIGDAAGNETGDAVGNKIGDAAGNETGDASGNQFEDAPGIEMGKTPGSGMKSMPRVLIAGANSGCGKTSITCGILKALCDRGLQIQSYKCGPDYIDPMLHGHITGTDCRNLDPFFSTEEDLIWLMAKDSQDADFTVTEGVMGYYDGIGVSCEKNTHTVSAATKSPTILIVNVKGMSHTMIPILKGLITYRDNPVKGVILNRCTKGLFDMMKPVIEEELGIRAVGYFPVKEGIHIGSRHLGLMTAAEISNLDEVISLLGETAKECIDLDLLLAIGQEAEPLPMADRPEVPEKKKARIAVAWDKAFCFYYKENLEILEQMGAELVYFSPVRDDRLPENIGGIYLGGGYPETYRRELSENSSMRADIREAAKVGKPIIAECGGFMYVCRNLIETDKSSMPMLGLVPTDVEMTSRLSMQFGYVNVRADRDTAYFDKDTVIRAHEFHYSRAKQRGDACTMVKSTGRCWKGLYVEDRILAGYPHFYFHNCRGMAERFVEMAALFT